MAEVTGLIPLPLAATSNFFLHITRILRLLEGPKINIFSPNNIYVVTFLVTPFLLCGAYYFLDIVISIVKRYNVD